MEKVKLYSKESCVQCTATERKMDDLGIDYEYIKLEELSDEEIQAFREDGLLRAPIVEAGAERWSGFRPDKLAEIALKRTME